MRPVRLSLRGFTSFKEEASVGFANLDRFAICGPTGAGKSSLLDAMTFALFANAPRVERGRLADMIALGSSSFSLVLDFRVRNQIYRVTRVRRRAGGNEDQLERGTDNDLKLLQSGADAVNREIERLLGLNYSHFTQAVFLPQGKFAEFLKTEPAKRRQLLNELLRLLVYKRMQEQANEELKGSTQTKAQTERRLQEDYQGVSAEALAELEKQKTEQYEVIEEARRQLPVLQERRDGRRQERQQTVELEQKSQELTCLEQKQPEIDAARKEIEAATRAAAVVPLLGQAEAAQREHAKRVQELDKANQMHDRLLADHAAAKDRLNQATSDAAPLPDPKEHLRRLHEAVGKIGLRDQLVQQRKEKQQQKQRLTKERAQAHEESIRLANAIFQLQIDLDQANAELGALDYDEKRHRQLDAVRETAAQLQHERRAAANAVREADQDGKKAANAEQVAWRAHTEAVAAEDNKKQAEQAKAAAEQALRAAEDAHRAAHLRAGLQPGEPCPVCRQPVDELPTSQPVPELEAQHEAVKAADETLKEAEETASRKRRLAERTQAQAEDARARADSSRALANRLNDSVLHEAQTLAERTGDLLTGTAREHVEDRILDTVAQINRCGEQYHQKSQHASNVRNDLVLKQQNREALERDIVRLDAELQSAELGIAEIEAGLEQVRGEIHNVAGTDDPGPVSKRVQQQIDALERELSEALQAEREANSALERASAGVDSCAREMAEAKRNAEQASAVASAALTQNAFPDAAATRKASRTPAQCQKLQATIEEHETELRSLGRRVTELEQALQGRRVTEAEAQQAEAEHKACQDRKQNAEKQAARWDQQIEQMRNRLATAEKLRRDLTDYERQYRIYYQLAQDLRSDKFQAFLLEETLTALVRDAAIHLARLTADRYALDFKDDRVLVVDNDNAGELRPVDTLSGGETFLASLSLALALSEQVQKAVGAVHLDCLFIDEGFGTLDPETLRIVGDAIRGLQVGGRMVGIITHIPELKEEFEQKILVEKDGGTSRVRVEVA